MSVNVNEGKSKNVSMDHWLKRDIIAMHFICVFYEQERRVTVEKYKPIVFIPRIISWGQVGYRVDGPWGGSVFNKYMTGAGQ